MGVREPGIGARILAFLFRILPKVGPLKALSFKPPTPQTEKFFQESFNKTMDGYRELLKEQTRGTSTRQPRLRHRRTHPPRRI